VGCRRALFRQSFEVKQKLLGGAGMELPPELGGERRHDAVQDLEAVDLGVVSRAERDEQPFPGNAWLSVMHVDAALRAFAIAADAAATSVALKDS
jgi:hypothetical protein